MDVLGTVGLGLALGEEVCKKTTGPTDSSTGPTLG